MVGKNCDGCSVKSRFITAGVLVDHFVRGYSIRQIARRHRIPMGTVLSRIFYGDFNCGEMGSETEQVNGD